jgi:Trp operon repressor
MYNTNERDKMSLKIDIIKKVLMLDTQHELENVLDVVGEAISRELDQDDKEQVEFKKWKAEVLKRKKEEDDKIRF